MNMIIWGQNFAPLPIQASLQLQNKILGAHMPCSIPIYNPTLAVKKKTTPPQQHLGGSSINS